MRHKLMLGAAGMAVLTGFVAPASAQTVDEIVVTAQKREQNLQDVPVVVTAVNAQQLQDAGVRDIKDLTVLTPGLMVTSTSNESVTTARIRGVGTVGDNPGLESSVGIVIDGVYRPRNGVGFGDLGEMERIEVLKGPQGTLFGKNTSAGVINILTQAPTFDYSVEGEATLGNYNARGGSLSVNVPLIEDRLAGRLYVAKRMRDGLYDTNVTGPRTRNEDNNQNFFTLRGQLLATPTDDLSIRFIGDYSRRNENCCTGVNLVRGSTQGALDSLVTGGATTNPVNPFARVTNANRDTAQKIEDQGLSAEVNWDTPWLGNAGLTSVTAWRNWQTENGQDSDFSRADLFYRNGDGTFGRSFEQFSQEFRLAGATDRQHWLVGAFYANEKLASAEQFVVGTQWESYLNRIFSAAGGLPTFTGLAAGTIYPTGGGQNDRYHQTSESLALFGNDNIELSDKLELTVGLRYTIEDKSLDAQYRNLDSDAGCSALLAREAINAGILGGGNAAAGRTTSSYALLYGYGCAPSLAAAFNNVDAHQSTKEKEFSGTVKLAYRWNDDIMTYVSYARGYKAGGFNLDRSRTGSFSTGFTVNPNTSFPGEFVDSYELGAKTTWLDRSLLLNAAAFHQEYENFQLNAYTGLSFIVSSIPKVVSRGVDADLMWFTPVDGLTLQGGVTFAETQYGSFTPGAGVSPRLPNSRLSFAPKWSGSTSVSYKRDLTEALAIRASVNAKYTSAYNTGSDLAPLKVQPELTLVNGRISLVSPDDKWGLELWGQNLSDEDYRQVVFDTPYQAGALNAFLGAPRTYGATLRVKY
jgi:iron complex outermembrane receptor protein